MKLPILTFIIRIFVLVAVSFLHSYSSEPYPSFEPVIEPFQADFETDVVKPLDAVIIRRLGRRIEQNDVLTVDEAGKIIEILSELESKVPKVKLQIVKPTGRMSLPKVIANNGHGLNCGLDEFYGIPLLAHNKVTLVALGQYAFCWQALLDSRPEMAFELLSHNDTNQSTTSFDIVRLYAALGYWPGEKLKGKVSKETWQKLHRSPNFVNRFIALEKFDSVKQNSAELLALYRECLFGACSYLEARALEAIYSNKDFREEVAKILDEYIASNPPMNDGTLPGLRNNFPNLIEGASRVIAAIRNIENPTTPTTLKPDPFSTGAAQPSTPPPSLTKPAAQLAEQTDSSHLLLWLVLIGAATGLLWLLLRRCKYLAK